MKMNSFHFYVILIGLLTLASCKTKNISSQNDVMRFDGKNWVKGPQKVNPNANSPSKDNVIVDLVDTLSTNPTDSLTPEINIKKDRYRIAVILPFMEDSVRRSWALASKKNFGKFNVTSQSEMSICFTEGMMMALNTMKLSSKYDIQFFDDKHSSANIEGILSQLKKDSFDLIIGPALKANLMEITKFARENNIPHLSPFSPSKTASLDNPNYYMVEPSLEQHLLTIINYGIDSIEKPNFKFLYHNSPSSIAYANSIAQYVDRYNDSLDIEDKISYSNIELGTHQVSFDFELDNYLDQGNNVIIVNSFDENFIHHFLRQLNTAEKNNKLTVFGMPGWETSETVRLDYINNGQIHFTQSYWIDEEDVDVINFQDSYEMKYEGTPNEFVFLGHDMASIFLKLMDENGLSFKKQLLDQTFKPLVNSYQFSAISKENGETQRIENTSLRIYKIEEFERILVK